MFPLTKAMSAIPYAVDDAKLHKNDPRESLRRGNIVNHKCVKTMPSRTTR